MNTQSHLFKRLVRLGLAGMALVGLAGAPLSWWKPAHNILQAHQQNDPRLLGAALAQWGAEAGEVTVTIDPRDPTDTISGPTVYESPAAGSFDGDLRNLPPVSQLKSSDEQRLEFIMPFESQLAAAGVTHAVDAVAQTSPVIAAPGSPSPNFAGLNISGGGNVGWPPDPHGDVSSNYYVQVVNTAMAVYNRSGGLLAAVSLNTLFAQVGTSGPCATANRGDPVVLYDTVSQRWVVSSFAFSDLVNGPYYQCIAVSRSSNPLTGWWLYTLLADANWINDYPKLGVWSDGIYMSANLFDVISGGGAVYKGVRVWALNRNNLINGSPLSTVAFSLGTNFFSLLPSHLRSTTPPAGQPAYFAALSPVTANTLQIWKFSANWGGTASFVGPIALPTSPFSSALGAVIPQAGTTQTLDALGGRLMSALAYGYNGGVESLWANHTVWSGGVTGIRWYQITNPNVFPSSLNKAPFSQIPTTAGWAASPPMA